MGRSAARSPELWAARGAGPATTPRNVRLTSDASHGYACDSFVSGIATQPCGTQSAQLGASYAAARGAAACAVRGAAP